MIGKHTNTDPKVEKPKVKYKRVRLQDMRELEDL